MITIPEVGWVMNGSLYVTASRISYNTTLCFSKDSQREVSVMIPATLHVFSMYLLLYTNLSNMDTHTHAHTFDCVTFITASIMSSHLSFAWKRSQM